MDLMRSLPLGLYLEQPVTWLHRLDSRVKLGWLMMFLLTPVLASPAWRVGLVGALILLTLGALIPLRVWRQQMGWLLVLCAMILVMTAIAPDGLAAEHQPRLPTSSAQISAESAAKSASAPSLPQPTDYSYVLFEQGPIKVTRQSLDLSVRVSTLIFTLIYSTNLFLLTTAPEEITAGLEDLMGPLRWLRVPVTEIALTLTLALRFIPLVLEEVQNLVRAVRTRAINWKKLGLRGATQIWLTVAERLLQNLLLRAEQIASAMVVRGFTSPDRHRVEWHQLRLRGADWIAIAFLVACVGARAVWGGEA
ncbi:energy-coupling factor transporter transmembrane protein EcfT [Geitlerinema sp. PCC 7407]|uniref:energy-coupling factor transporter transmembrane component T family protein n=1 Tax=Geitlerinema sp. PCC 7407 TaxID=1173025 RepID=UPI00029FD898|nr:CbiQ family ECF transporter T component [Geitlerinema sp. PCC 7407]AFY65441.1 cobalt transport protein [Geitlerinema sp. PCC 7407]